MIQIISLIVLLVATGYMIQIRKQAKIGQAADTLSGVEKISIWVISLLNPVFSGAVFYYGWRKLLPAKAKKANQISLWAFLIEIVLGVLYGLFLYHQ